MNRILVWLIVVFIPASAGWQNTHAQTASASVPSANASVLLTLEGKVDIARAGSAQWTPGTTNQVLLGGDRVRTGPFSRAAIRLSDLSVLRMSELTTLQIRPPPAPDKKPLLEVLKGWIYFFNRERPRDVEFRTPLASGAIRGTEFHIFVAEDGRTIVTLLDGEVALSNEQGELLLRSGEQGTIMVGQAPLRTPVLDLINVIQWSLYYPAVLDPDEVALTPNEKADLTASLDAYRNGDLLQALSAYPENRDPASDAEKVYRAALLLAAGQVSPAETLLTGLDTHQSLVRALQKMILTVKGQATNRMIQPASATEYLVEAYYLQSLGELEAAREAAYAVARRSAAFGFGWARVAELEFGFARIDAATRAVDKAIQLSPRNAQALVLKGFFLAAKESNDAAFGFFNRAIAIDGGLGNAWLGRGLVQIHQGDAHQGRADLQVAAALEPQRSLLRSYLGKAFSHGADNLRAIKELNLAKRLDPNDPTAWLYSALILQKQNRINEAITDLEKSKNLNENRRLWRSKLLLDQDRAVRSANLASIYRDAGMTDVSVWEASRAVNDDYANYSAHLFLANSYDALRDPKQINLRYETPWLSELLTANLLAPAGGGNLSQNISQQEYSRLFEEKHLGISSSTEYYSSGDWVQRGSQYGYMGKTSYALDGLFRTENGQRPNNDLEQWSVSAKLKFEITPKDSLFFRYWNYAAESGDLTQYYNQTNANQGLRVDEKQDLNFLAGYHRAWAPGSHSLFLVGWFNDRVEARDTDPSLIWLRRDGSGQIVGVEDPGISSPGFTDYAFTNRTRFEAVSTEFQQIWEAPDHAVIVGVRGQFGWADSFDHLGEQTTQTTLTMDRFDTEMNRITAYAYDQWQIADSLRLTVGLSYDRLHYPENLLIVPLTDDEATDYHLSPKAGLLWNPWKNAYLRLAYTRSLGGVFFDNSIRLEPTQVAGFNQAFRSVLPESVAGLVPASEFETFHAGFEWMTDTRTYLGIEGEALRSSALRSVGVLTNSPFFPFLPNSTSQTRQALDFEERSGLVTLNQLLGDEWAFGARYRITHADLETRFKEAPATALNARADVSALLHQLRFYLLFHHPTGVFAQADSVWSHQSNDGYTPGLPDEDFWQFNFFVGYRFLRRQAELRVGVLNITDQDYRLNPLTLYSELPRERTLVASLRLYF